MNQTTDQEQHDPLSWLLSELPMGVALFDEHGSFIESNAPFAAIVRQLGRDTPSLTSLFGQSAVQNDSEAEIDTLTLDGRHYAPSLKKIDGTGWICHLQDVTRWIEAQDEPRAVATYDALTGLHNRAFLLPELERALAQPARLAALLMVDLDRFKTVNDTLGHDVGDALLVKVTARLRASIRMTDKVARLGGDEFAVLQLGVTQPGGAETLAKRLVEVLSRPYVLSGHMIDIGASIGVAVLGAEVSAQTVLKQADLALYRSKQNGRGRYSFFEQEMDDAMHARRALELDLRRALAFRQFELHYQPQMSLDTRRITGMEALIRWHHPTRGLVSPADFIPLAEETGLIVPIGEWVMRQACEDAAAWSEDLTVAVNVSARQLCGPRFVATVANAVASAGIAPARLEVEITESVLMSDTEESIDTLHRLRHLGVRISMDDFGTGYSSLSYLRSFPFDKIKIDQSFVRSGDPEENASIISAIAAIGRHLGMATIAEGVETEQQLGDIVTSGCGSAQGYLISRPVPAHEIAAVLARWAGSGGAVIQHAPAAMNEPIAVAALDQPDLYRLVYYSRNTIFGVHDDVSVAVDDILAASQRNNARVGVTGALMFTDGFFAQVLEGPREAVELVFERIQLDDRHAEVSLLSFDRIDSRVFARWSMAFVGNDAAAKLKFGHYAPSSGFDISSARSDKVVDHLLALLLDEERVAGRRAA